MFCKFCGSLIDDNSIFCSNCGKNISSDYIKSAATHTAEQESPVDDKDESLNFDAILGKKDISSNNNTYFNNMDSLEEKTVQRTVNTVPEIVVKDGFFFKKTGKLKALAFIALGVFITLWTAALTVLIFFPQYSNFI